MDTSPRLCYRYVWCLFVVCCKLCRGDLIAANVTGFGEDTTVFTCSSPDISLGDNYLLRKDRSVIYTLSDEGTIVDGKYNASAEVGKIKLYILNTNISDAGVYLCDHRFTLAPGTVSVAFKPKIVTATTSQQDHMWTLSVSAYKVFPLGAKITGASCLSPDNTVAVFQMENQVVNTNNEEKYLYDIFWNGTINRTLSGNVQCNITIVVIDTIVSTIDVSFQEPDSTSEPFPVWGIIGILLSAVCFILFTVIVMLIHYTRMHALYHKRKGGRPDTGGRWYKTLWLKETENRAVSTTRETTKETLLAKPPQTTVQDGYQHKEQSIKQRQLREKSRQTLDMDEAKKQKEKGKKEEKGERD